MSRRKKETTKAQAKKQLRQKRNKGITSWQLIVLPVWSEVSSKRRQMSTIRNGLSRQHSLPSSCSMVLSVVWIGGTSMQIVRIECTLLFHLMVKSTECHQIQVQDAQYCLGYYLQNCFGIALSKNNLQQFASWYTMQYHMDLRTVSWTV